MKRLDLYFNDKISIEDTTEGLKQQLKRFMEENPEFKYLTILLGEREIKNEDNKNTNN